MNLRRCILVILVLLFGGAVADVFAQDAKTVSGKVFDKDNPSNRLAGVHVFAFESKYECEDEYKKLKKRWGNGEIWVNIQKPEVRTDAQGYYEIPVNPDGGLLFVIESGDSEPVYTPVKGRLQIDARIKMGRELGPSVKTAEGLNKPPKADPPKPKGDTVFTKADFFLPKGGSMSMGRLILQPYLVNYESLDTVARLAPVVRDGAEYHITQLRRMAYQEDVDPLYAYAQKDSLLVQDTIPVRKTFAVRLPDHENLYVCNCDWWVEDYTKVFYEPDDFLLFRSNRLADDMKFLDFKAERFELDLMEYQQKAQRQYLKTKGDINVHFPVGKAFVDLSDTVSVAALNTLKKQLHDAVSQDGATIRQFRVEGVASPEGTYASNKSLADKRMQYILDQIRSILPRYHVDYETSSRVATWEEVAKLLETDGKTDQAARIREICAKVSNMDEQGRRIRQLPFYQSEVMPRLPALRSVKYTSVIDIFRELSPEEIYDKYMADRDYHTGKKDLEYYEFWNLFQVVKDPLQLDTLCRLAIDKMSVTVEKDGKKERRSSFYWPLPANLLALSLLDKDIADTTVLAEYIDLSWPLNMKFMNNGVVEREVNKDVILANQVVMMFKAGFYGRAAQMAKMFEKHPDKRFKHLYMFTRALAGYWEDEEDLQQAIIESSPRNAVVMNLALGKTGTALMYLEQLDPEDPLTLYMKAQLLCRKYETFYALQNATEYSEEMMDEDFVVDEAKRLLTECFKKDASYVEVAKGDYYMFEELIDEVLPRYMLSLEEGAFKQYLKAMITCRQSKSYSKMTQKNLDKAVAALAECFRQDESYIIKARGDFYVFREVVNAALDEVKK